MYQLNEAQKRQIEQQFHNYCLTVLQNEACDIHRQYERQRAKEKFLDDLTSEELLGISTGLEIVPDIRLSIGTMEIPIYDEVLANALQQLSQYKREIILYYFFLEKTEAEIAKMYNRTQQSINYQRKAIFKQLKQYLELEELL